MLINCSYLSFLRASMCFKDIRQTSDVPLMQCSLKEMFLSFSHPHVVQNVYYFSFQGTQSHLAECPSCFTTFVNNKSPKAIRFCVINCLKFKPFFTDLTSYIHYSCWMICTVSQLDCLYRCKMSLYYRTALIC